MQVKKIKLSKLRKLQMPEITRSVISALKSHDVKKLNLEFQLKTLEKIQLKIKTLDVPLGPDPMNEQLYNLHNQRLNYAASITNQMKGISQANLQHLRKEVYIAQKVVKGYLVGLRNNNKNEIETLIDIFVTVVNKKPEVNNAFTKIGLMPYINELQLANETYSSLYLKRNSSQSKRQRRDENKAIVREGQAVLRSIFEQVDLANRLYPELNYKPLIMELNTIIAEFTNIINTRATYNKKRALKAQQEKDAAAAPKTVTEVQLMCMDKKPTGVMVIKKKEDKEDKELGKDEKKDDEEKGPELL